MSFFTKMPSLRRLLLGLALLSFATTSPARPRPHYAVAGHEQPVALLHAGKATYLVTAHSVFRLEGPKFVRKQQLTNTIQCAALADTVLWLGTNQGVLRLNTQTLRPRPLALPGAEAPSITALFRDAQGEIWVGANGYGVFRWVNGTFSQELHTPAINGGVATADSSVWIATSIGLSRKQGAEWTRYNEEGVANHEIPDNIVEKLLPDNAGNLWVIMSDAICVFEGSQHAAAEAELPTVKFIGRPGNEVFGVVSVAGDGRLFATSQGLLLLPNEPATPLPGFAPATDKVAPKQLLVPLPTLPGTTSAQAKPRLIQADQQRIWLVSEDEVIVLTTNAFHRFIQASTAAKGGSKSMGRVSTGH